MIYPPDKFEKINFHRNKQTLRQIYAVLYYMEKGDDHNDAIRKALKSFSRVNDYQTIEDKCGRRFAGDMPTFLEWYKSGTILSKLDSKFELKDDKGIFEELLKTTIKEKNGHDKDKDTEGDIKGEELKVKIEKLGERFSIQSLYFDSEEEIISQITTALKNGKHIILIGPPGTGKSKLAKVICEFYCGDANYSMSTATSDWSTFETIGGYRPNKSGELEFFPGIFLHCFQDKNRSPINKWLIIDEINRADIDKAFGSLFSALTGDDITLPFEISGERIKIIGKPTDNTGIRDNHFIIPQDWRIIATMNTFDKTSLYEMSYAFMRRFAFISIDVPTNIGWCPNM